ncbi:transporter substrate-binding domain-containing protein [Bradyrhizobium iriomotense]|uniref:Ectoine/hydroxyectoine ABC transporter substrate-binding protein EhuB n=1 Tax=Bradyrhizobium iriomotense TaxID=441950 RepID=A0ABQ6BDQ7_9BRAD|nr:transporter substrate-binding domain-containing protein [Bradyrhizobium iriomotense]GLR92188.1 ectoine/hydroxyectoine ABC transporter substrate-binding protein EhuB [Bradyrhizobium iriomotense]
MRVRSKLSLLLVALTGCSFPTSSQTEDSLLVSIRKAGKVKVAVASLPPYMMMSPSGEATGAIVDLHNMVLKRLGLPALTPVFTQWDAMIPGLQAHQFDYVASLAITEARCKQMLFSGPQYAYQLGLFVLPGNPKSLTSVADVARSRDIKMAIITSAAWMTYVLKQGVKSEQFVRVPDVQASLATVVGGRADVYIDSQVSIPSPEQKGVELVVDEQSPVFVSGAVFRKEDVRFRDAFSEQLHLLIRSGAIQDLSNKYGVANGHAEAELLARLTKASDAVPSCE